MRKLATAVVAAGLFFGGMGVAVADSSTRQFDMTTTGARFFGKYQWQPKDRVPSGLHVDGVLRDDKGDDGHNVYLQVKVEGYAWGRHNGVQRKDTRVNEVYRDGAVLVTDEVRVKVCRDRGSLRPDNCSPSRVFTR